MTKKTYKCKKCKKKIRQKTGPGRPRKTHAGCAKKKTPVRRKKKAKKKPAKAKKAKKKAKKKSDALGEFISASGYSERKPKRSVFPKTKTGTKKYKYALECWNEIGAWKMPRRKRRKNS